MDLHPVADTFRVSQAQTPLIEVATVNLAKSYLALTGSNFSLANVCAHGHGRLSFAHRVFVYEHQASQLGLSYESAVLSSPRLMPGLEKT
jgi:hypothetical protein